MNPQSGHWHAWLWVVADNLDSAGDFYVAVDVAYAKAESPFIGRRFYYSPDAGDQTHIYPNIEAPQTDF